MHIDIDLNTRIIRDTTRIWIVHPGTRRRFYSTFFDESVVFLEYPGLDLSQKVLKDVDALRQRIRYSQALSHLNAFGSSGQDLSFSQFTDAPDTDVTTPLRTIRHLYGAAKRGDLVIVPGIGAYSATMFGEIITSFDENDLIKVPQFSRPLHVRKVKWLSTDRLRNELPPELARLFEKPPAVVEIRRDDSTDRFFDYAYRSYIKGDEGWSLVSADGYRGNDPRATIAPNKLIVLSVALYNAANAKADLSKYSIDQIIDKFYTTEDIDDFSSRFTSPGKYGFKAGAAALAIFVTCSVAVFTAKNQSAGAAAEYTDISIGNSGDGYDEDIKMSQESINYAIRSMNPDALREATSLGQQASRDVNMKSDAQVTIRPN